MFEKKENPKRCRSLTYWGLLLVMMSGLCILGASFRVAAQSSAHCPVYVEKLNNIHSLADQATNERCRAFAEKLAEMYTLADQSCQAHIKGNSYFEEGSPRADFEYQRALDLDERILEKIRAIVPTFGVTAELKAKLEEAQRLYSQQVNFYAQSNQLSAQAGMAYRIGNRTVGDRLLDRANSTNDSANQLEDGAFALLEEAAELLCEAASEEGAPQAVSPSTTPSIIIQVPTVSGPTETVTGRTDAKGKFTISVPPATAVTGILTECTQRLLPDREFDLTPVPEGFVVSATGYQQTTLTEFTSISIFGIKSVDLGEVCLLPGDEEATPTGTGIPSAGEEEKKPDYVFTVEPCLLLAPAEQPSAKEAFFLHDPRLYPIGEGLVGLDPKRLPVECKILLHIKVSNPGEAPAGAPVVHLKVDGETYVLPAVKQIPPFPDEKIGYPQYWELETLVPQKDEVITLAGDHLPFFQAVIDPDDAVEELSEANNAWDGDSEPAYTLRDAPKIIKPTSPDDQPALVTIKGDGTWVVRLKKTLTVEAKAQIDEAVVSAGAVVSPGIGHPCTPYAPLDLRYTWDFGDGVQASGKEAAHTYSKSGKYTITITTTLGEEQRSTTQAVDVTNKPVVTALSQQYERVFVGGVSVDNTFTAQVDPNGNTLERVEFVLNGETKLGQLEGMLADYTHDMGSLQLWPADNTLQVIAVARDPDGQEVCSDLYPAEALTIPVASVPSWLEWMLPLQAGPKGNRVTYTASFSFPEIPIKLSYEIPDWIPLIGGEYSFEAGSRAGLSLSSLGPGSLSGEGHAGFEKSSGDWTFSFSGGAEGQAALSIGPPIVLTQGEFSLGLDGSVSKTFDLCDTFPPLRVASRHWLFGRLIRWACSRVELGVGLSLGVAGDVSFASADPGCCLTGIDCEGGALLSGGLQASLSASLLNVTLSVFGGGTLTANFTAPGSEFAFLDFHSLVLSGTVGGSVEVDLFLGSLYKEFSISFDCRILSPAQGFTTMTETEWQLLEREYASPNYATFRGEKKQVEELNTTEIWLVEEVFPHAQPKLAWDRGLTLVAWTTDDLAKPYPLGREITYCSGSELDSLGAPQAVTDNLLPDCQVDLALDPMGNPLAVWVQHVSPPPLPKSEQELTPELLAGLEILWSRYDRRAGQWSEPARLTNNRFVDHSPTFLHGPSGITGFIWTANSHGGIFPDASDPDTLYLARWDGQTFTEPEVLREGETALMRTFVDLGDRVLYVWVEDMDEDWETADDEELFSAVWDGVTWGTPERLTQNDLDDERPVLLPAGLGRAMLLWVRIQETESSGREGTLLRRAFGPDGWLPETTVLNDRQIFDFQATQARDGRIALIWEAFSAQGPDLFTAVYDPIDDTTSEPRQLTADPHVESQVDVVFDGHTLAVAVVRTTVENRTMTVCYTGPDAGDPTIFYEDKEVEITAPMPVTPHLYLLETTLP